MIRRFSDRTLESFYYDGPGPQARRIPAEIFPVLRRKLDQLANAISVMDLRVPPAKMVGVVERGFEGFLQHSRK